MWLGFISSDCYMSGRMASNNKGDGYRKQAPFGKMVVTPMYDPGDGFGSRCFASADKSSESMNACIAFSSMPCPRVSVLSCSYGFGNP